MDTDQPHPLRQSSCQASLETRMVLGHFAARTSVLEVQVFMKAQTVGCCLAILDHCCKGMYVQGVPEVTGQTTREYIFTHVLAVRLPPPPFIGICLCSATVAASAPIVGVRIGQL